MNHSDAWPHAPLPTGTPSRTPGIVGLIGRWIQTPRRRLADFLAAQHGAAMIEFAMLMPLLTLLLLGAAELSQALTAQRKMLRATSVVGDMVVRKEEISRRSLRRLFRAAEAILQPTNAHQFNIVATGIEFDPDIEQYRVVWSHSRRQAPDNVGSVFMFDNDRRLSSSFYVVVTIRSIHRGTITQYFSNGLIFEKQLDFIPRQEGPIRLTSACLEPSSLCQYRVAV